MATGVALVTVGGTPFTSSSTVGGAPLALDTSRRLPVAASVDGGVAVTDSVQDAAGARVAPQVLADSAKGPLIVKDEIVRSWLPVLVSVTFCGAEVAAGATTPKFSPVGARPATGAVVRPTPVRVTTLGSTKMLVSISSAPVRVPLAVGVNVTGISQEAPTASVPTQLVDAAKSPVAAMPVICTGTPPLFVMRTDWGELVCPTRPPLKATVLTDTSGL